MRLYDVRITHLSRRPARVARWLVILAPAWMIFGTALLAWLELDVATGVSLLASFVTFLVAGVVALAFQGGTALGVRRGGEPGAISVTTGCVHARVDDRELEERVVSGLREELPVPDELPSTIDPPATTHQVLLELHSGDTLAVTVRDAEQADALLDAAGVGLRQRAIGLRVGRVDMTLARVVIASIFVGSLLLAVPAVLLLVLVFDSRTGGRDVAAAVVAACVLGVVLSRGALAVQTVRLGSDGVLVQSSRVFRTFVPFAGMKLRRVDWRVGLRSGTRTASIVARSAEQAERILQRIELAKQDFERREHFGASVLARNGRSLAEWRRELHALVLDQGYRAPISRAELAAIAEDPGSARDQRIAAVLALSASAQDDAERARLRVAVDTTVDPKLRLALERAYEDELVEALVDAASEA
ncbi:MAG: hypothetical protein HYV09_22120 [Deltaproteobacteria bacterium]|nr:hypothetical protein [Deltaproteobacteria bacterium]